MLQFKTGDIPDLSFSEAVKKPIPQRVCQIHEPFEVESLEGVVRGKAGDYLMVGIQGELYICDKEIFAQTYDLLPTNTSEIKTTHGQ